MPPAPNVGAGGQVTVLLPPERSANEQGSYAFVDVTV